MRKFFVPLLAAGLMLADLSAQAATSQKLVIAMLPKAKGNAYFLSCKAGADKAAKTSSKAGGAFRTAGAGVRLISVTSKLPLVAVG